VRWSPADAALLDDAREVLGPSPRRGGRRELDDEIRTYGHIVIDEVQDLTPMQLAMARRRSLNGSMTVVGDIAQATGPLAPDSWDEVIGHLPDRRPARIVGLSVGYRIPAQIMELATPVMEAATPGLRVPNSVRIGDASPRVVAGASVLDTAVTEIQRLRSELEGGSVAAVVPDSIVAAMSEALDAAGVDHGRAGLGGLDRHVTVVPVSVVKGLELDGVVVVEPARIVAEEPHGLRSLYVALTRATRRLSVVHSEPLPEPLRRAAAAAQAPAADTRPR